MLRFILRRVLWGCITLLIFSTFLFFLAHILMPGDFLTQFAESVFLSQGNQYREEMAAWRAELGLDRPLWEQYLRWLSHVVRGDLGPSLFGGQVVDILKVVIPPTLLVFFTGALIAFLFGQWLGKVAAWRAPRLLAGSAVLGSIALYTAFPPWLASLVVYFITGKAGMWELMRSRVLDPYFGIFQDSHLPPGQVMLYMTLSFALAGLAIVGLNRAVQRRFRRSLHPLLALAAILGLGVGSWFLLGFGAPAWAVLKIASVPILVFVLLSFGETMLIMRTTMMDTLHEDYVIVARAKGLPEAVVRDKHAARNAFLPVLSSLVVGLPYMLTGLVIVEQAVGWQGMGSALFSALVAQDMPVVLGGLLAVGVLSLLVRLGLDIAYAVLDPRIRYNRAERGAG